MVVGQKRFSGVIYDEEFNVNLETKRQNLSPRLRWSVGKRREIRSWMSRGKNANRFLIKVKKSCPLGMFAPDGFIRRSYQNSYSHFSQSEWTLLVEANNIAANNQHQPPRRGHGVYRCIPEMALIVVMCYDDEPRLQSPWSYLSFCVDGKWTNTAAHCGLSPCK